MNVKAGKTIHLIRAKPKRFNDFFIFARKKKSSNHRVAQNLGRIENVEKINIILLK